MRPPPGLLACSGVVTAIAVCREADKLLTRNVPGYYAPLPFDRKRAMPLVRSGRALGLHAMAPLQQALDMVVKGPHPAATRQVVPDRNFHRQTRIWSGCCTPKALQSATNISYTNSLKEIL